MGMGEDDMKQKQSMSAVALMKDVYVKLLPSVKSELSYWRKKATHIPNTELRKQALLSLEYKKFHCHGGGIYAFLAGSQFKEAIRFIVAYQTISDYLDNLCDRSTSLDPRDFEQLHQSMLDVFTGEKTANYYTYREDQDDGGYLLSLVQACQEIVERLEIPSMLHKHLLQLNTQYRMLQIHKHVKHEERLPRLLQWYEQENHNPDLLWQEFAAASGSTLGIFCLISYCLQEEQTDAQFEHIFSAYYPYIQGLHILLDYVIDQEEDVKEGDLNFCAMYESDEVLLERLLLFIETSLENVRKLPDSAFHRLIVKGLVGLYLSDDKTGTLRNGAEIKKACLQRVGGAGKIFYWNTKLYYALSKGR